MVRPFCSSMNIISSCFSLSVMKLLISLSCSGVHISEVRLVSTVRVFTRVDCRQEQQKQDCNFFMLEQLQAP